MKEIQANILALDAGLMSRSEAIAERGGDFDEISEQIAHERARRAQLGIDSAAPGTPTTPPVSEDAQDEEHNSEQRGERDGEPDDA